MALTVRRTARAGVSLLVPAALLTGCLPNNPYLAEDAGRNAYYSTFDEPPKTMDPAVAYTVDAWRILGLVCEPLLQYDYLARPFRLVPCAAAELPRAETRDGLTAYTIRLKRGLRYAPHPCFAPEAFDEDVSAYRAIGDFRHRGTRELTAEDYVTQIKRLADPTLQPGCPILPIMEKYLLGMEAYAAALRKDVEAERAARRTAGGPLYSAERDERDRPVLAPLDRHPLPGAVATGSHTLRITIRGSYPQMLYWLALPFFAPAPREALAFYGRPAMRRRNLTLANFPVGSGPYRLDVYRPEHLITLKRSETYRNLVYPSNGSREDRTRGLLADAGRPLPFIDDIILTLEKEAIPRWTKFQQGYFDSSAVPEEGFDQAVQFTPQGDVAIAAGFEERGVRLESETALVTYYLAFNMLDATVGGLTEPKRKLRRAIAIAMDTEERIQIFHNGMGRAAQGFIPPGIFGWEDGPAGMDPFVYDWDAAGGIPRRKPLAEAKRLLADAGYPGGRNPAGKPLVIRFANAWNDSEHVPLIQWLTQKCKAIGIELVSETTDYNRFQEKADQGNYQVLSWGWHADYPDAENFLFLLFGPNSRAKGHGENVSNYDSPEFNALFRRLENMQNGPARLALIRQAMHVARRDAPLVWGFHPVTLGLYHRWLANTKPHAVANDTLKYLRLDPDARRAARAEWNHPVLWPVAIVLVLLAAAAVPAILAGRRAT